MEIKGLQSRESLSEKIIKQISIFKTSTYILIGPSGSGKKYTLNKIYNNLIKKDIISIIEFIDDQMICRNISYKDKQKKVQFTASFYLGVSVFLEEKNQSKLNYIISSLKEIKNRNIVLYQPDIEKSNESAKQILKLIVNNKKFIEDNTDKVLSVLCSADSSNKEYSNSWAFDNRIFFSQYEKNDIDKYLTDVLKVNKDEIKNYNKKLQTAFEISNGNLNLINIIYKSIFQNSIDYSDSLLRIVELRINETKKVYSNDIVSEQDLEDIILCSSLCIHYFNKNQIAYVTGKTKQKSNEGLNIYHKSYFFEKTNDKYSFLSKEIKQILEKKEKSYNNDTYIEFYNYASLYKHDDYYERAYYLMKFYNGITPEVFALFVMAISKCYAFDDMWKVERIKDYICEYSLNSNYLLTIHIIIDAYNCIFNKNYVDAINELDKIDYNFLNTLTLLEVKRIKFRAYYYASNTDSLDCLNLIEALKFHAKSSLKLDFKDSNIIRCDEYIERLQIIYDIAPCIIDDYNDAEEFEELYDTSIKICKHIEQNNLSTFTTKYILSIFNRKAFLFSNPMAANIYYEQSKQFFYQNNIFDEYCITLICYAGTMLACSNYKDSIKYCNEAYEIIDSKNIQIPTPQKLDNNYLIANFLLQELELKEDFQEIKKAANKAATKLREESQFIDSSACKHVMLTNAASLFLYSENYDFYDDVKKELELSLDCDDVSNIDDENINDFYRYHFAWFELFYSMQKKDWERCKQLIAKLDDFIPALFKKAENLWKRKNLRVKELINNQEVVDSYYFCNNLVKAVNKRDKYNAFYYRGLPVSDLQYTSYN